VRLSQVEADARWQREQKDREREAKEQAERRLSATRGVVTRIRNRVANGVCPCCNRTFADLHRHMASQHPEFVEMEQADE
jgi:hypothetical protein